MSMMSVVYILTCCVVVSATAATAAPETPEGLLEAFLTKHHLGQLAPVFASLGIAEMGLS